MVAPTTLSYAAGADHQLDLRVPKSGAGPFPTVIWIHGGGWKSGTRANAQQAVGLVCKGYAVASIDYRLSGTAPFPAQIFDVKAAIRYLRANALAHNLDPARFATFGSSAGGHLSALAATSGGVADLEDLTQGNPMVSSTVQAGVAWYAPTDIGQMDAELLAQGCPSANHGIAGSAESDFLGCTVNSQACVPAIDRANPITYVGSSTPPLFMLHGTADCTVPNAQTTLLQQAMDAAGRCALKRNVVGAGHGGPEWLTSPVQDTVQPFLDAVLKP
jgi:acetyl esterase/lipase